MFLKSSKFKKILKEAYKNETLRVGDDGLGIYISGGYWGVWVKHEKLPKKELANIIELTGLIPNENEMYLATKGGNQYELPDKTAHNAKSSMTSDNEEKRLKEAVITRVMVQHENGVVSRVLQDSVNKAFLLNERFIEMIDLKAVDKEGGETAPDGPFVTDKIAYWENNTMILMAYFRTDDDVYDLVKHLETREIEEI